MKDLHFIPKYFNKKILDDFNCHLRIEISEEPCINIYEEDYSLRIITSHENEGNHISRNYAIEHHLNQELHNYPHLKLRFHSERIGQLFLKIDIDSKEDYIKVIKGFIFQIKKILEKFERIRPNIVREILVLDLVNKLEKEYNHFLKKIDESIAKHNVEFQKKIDGSLLDNVKNNDLLRLFFNEKQIDLQVIRILNSVLSDSDQNQIFQDGSLLILDCFLVHC